MSGQYLQAKLTCIFCTYSFFDETMVDSEASRQQWEYDKFDRMLQDSCATPVKLPFDFLKSITNDFSEERVLGRGGFGEVYKVC